ncbi:MAG: ketoacyl-ACP synthase III [Saprospiraceae bacterium]|jgi:3-oxoacyl-[acyl-carrier-protein] synthase-3|nr:ketoacyl-ACP synthase III [Saprospiraceae bacterium]MCC6841838.1 ketoacyl-ACP synthase III [Saprospiraceae bacterium]HRG32886.1 ketoacyl-ACP synthase III [Saprospiraceae bacterium]
MKINILAIEKYLPKNILTSESLDKLSNGRKGRIEKNTGVRFRHHISDQENVCEMGAIALQKALTKSNTKAEDIDLLIYCGASYDYPVPHNSVIIKSKIANDKINFPCFDVDSTCLSFLNALDIGQLYLQSGRYHRIALVCSEVSSKALSPHDEKVFGLFGDAAVAIIIESSDLHGYIPKFIHFTNYPSGAMLAHVPIGGALNRGINTPHADLGYYFKMDGRKLIFLTIKHLDELVAKIEQSVQCKITDFDFIITHQTSKYGNEYFLDHFKLDQNKVLETLSIYGNCISASIPLGLEQLINSKLSLVNKKILLLGSGAGLSLGTIVLEF